MCKRFKEGIGGCANQIVKTYVANYRQLETNSHKKPSHSDYLRLATWANSNGIQKSVGGSSCIIEVWTYHGVCYCLGCNSFLYPTTKGIFFW